MNAVMRVSINLLINSAGLCDIIEHIWDQSVFVQHFYYLLFHAEM